MFDAIGVYERTRRPWTMAVSLSGQAVMIGLAILVPLVTTEALPHARLLIDVLPLPPSGTSHPKPQVAVRPVKTIPLQAARNGFFAPVKIPERVAMLQDPEDLPAADGVVGVPGGIPGSGGQGNPVIDGLLRAMPVVAPAPPPVTPAKEGLKPVKRIVIGGNVQMGKLISGPKPVFPALARQAGISGTVHLQAVISRDGTVMNLHAVSGHPFLAQAAMDAVKRWVFQPTSLNGDPVEVATEIVVTFSLQH